MGTYEWNEAISAAVFKDAEGQIRLAVLTRPSDDIIAKHEAMYPELPIRQGINDCFPEVR